MVYANTGNLTLEIRRVQQSNIANSTMATITANTTGTLTDGSTTSISNATIDNDTYYYYGRLNISTGGGQSTDVYSVKITYTVTEPLP